MGMMHGRLLAHNAQSLWWRAILFCIHYRIFANDMVLQGGMPLLARK